MDPVHARRCGSRVQVVFAAPRASYLGRYRRSLVEFGYIAADGMAIAGQCEMDFGLSCHRSPDQMGALYDALDGLATGTDPWGVIVAAFVGYRQNAPQRAIGKRATHEMQAEVRFAQANSGGCGFLHSAMHRVVSAFVHVVIVNAHILTSDFCEWVDGSSLSRCAPRACPDGQDCRSRRPRDWRGAVFHARQHRNCTELVYIPGHPSPPSGPHPAMRNAVHASVFLPW